MYQGRSIVCDNTGPPLTPQTFRVSFKPLPVMGDENLLAGIMPAWDVVEAAALPKAPVDLLTDKRWKWTPRSEWTPLKVPPVPVESLVPESTRKTLASMLQDFREANGRARSPEQDAADSERFYARLAETAAADARLLRPRRPFAYYALAIVACFVLAALMDRPAPSIVPALPAVEDTPTLTLASNLFTVREAVSDGTNAVALVESSRVLDVLTVENESPVAHVVDLVTADGQPRQRVLIGAHALWQSAGEDLGSVTAFRLGDHAPPTDVRATARARLR